MARNRKRAKERRGRRPQGASVAAPHRVEREATPDPIEHAAPDVELAEAQLALGRADRPENPRADVVQEAEPEPELGVEPGDEALEPGDQDETLEDETVDGELGSLESDRVRDGAAEGRELAAHRAHVAERHAPAGNRLINFLQGSWRELQRVQWPDRRQVMQATSVVIGFVIVAGVFLGVADFLAAKLMNYILK